MNKVILAIDVGLRNLAVCIMTAENKNDMKTYKIHVWDVYNVLDGDDYHCQNTFKNGNLCNRICTMKYIPIKQENQSYIYCCKTHFPKDIKQTKLNQFKKKRINEYLLQDIATAFILKVQEIYDNNPIFKSVTTIQIELQPRINQKSLFTSHILYGKLVELYKNTNTSIRFIRASQKLKIYKGPSIVCNLKGKYAQRKWLSIQYTKWFLENKFNNEEREKWLPIFNSHSKMDDLADAANYCINFFQTKK